MSSGEGRGNVMGNGGETGIKQGEGDKEKEKRESKYDLRYR